MSISFGIKTTQVDTSYRDVQRMLAGGRRH